MLKIEDFEWLLILLKIVKSEEYSKRILLEYLRTLASRVLAKRHSIKNTQLMTEDLVDSYYNIQAKDLNAEDCVVILINNALYLDEKFIEELVGVINKHITPLELIAFSL